MIFGTELQLSNAVAVPVLDGNCESWQFIVVAPGQVITGASLSLTVTVKLQLPVLPLPSVAV